MGSVEWFALAFLAGITLYGLSGTLLELLVGEKLSFSAPFSTRRNLARLLAAPLLAGPLMLFNDAMDARAADRITTMQFVSCAATCLVWTCAMGVAMLEVAALMLSL